MALPWKAKTSVRNNLGTVEMLRKRGQFSGTDAGNTEQVWWPIVPNANGNQIVKSVPTGRSRAALTAALGHHTILFRNLLDAVLVHDVEGRVIDVNDKTLEMYETTRGEAIGLSIVSDYLSLNDGSLLDYSSLAKKAIAGEGQRFESKV